MNVLVERYQRRKYVNQEDSPMLYYVRQKSGTVRVMDVDKTGRCHRSQLFTHSRRCETCHRSFCRAVAPVAHPGRQSEDRRIWVRFTSR